MATKRYRIRLTTDEQQELSETLSGDRVAAYKRKREILTRDTRYSRICS